MKKEKNVRVIPPKPKNVSRIGAYCRVSTRNEIQDNSLEN